LIGYAAAVLQWSDASSNMAFAVSTTVTGSEVDLYLSMLVPEQAGWASIGVGSGMAGALMFVIYPSNTGCKYITYTFHELQADSYLSRDCQR